MPSSQSPRAATGVVASPARQQRRLFFLLSILLLALATATSISLAPPVSAQTQSTAEATAADVAEQVRDSAVTVYVYSAGGTWSPGQTGREPDAAGSGWVYSSDGLVVTNAHVVDGAEKVLVVLDDGTQIPASIVGTDWYRDVAVLQLEPENGQQLPPAATVGDSSAVRPGDEVVAIGTPLGQFANTVTVGYVGAVDRSLNTGVGYSLRHLIQHDASLSPGNSGGPLVDMNGEVIGMNVARVDAVTSPSSDTISFAIDGDTVVGAAKEIVANGSVAYPYLGVQIDQTSQGPVVASVEPGSPAASAGLRQGDAVLAIDGEPVDADTGVIDLLYRHKVGDTVTMTVSRGGEQQDLEVTLASRPAGL